MSNNLDQFDLDMDVISKFGDCMDKISKDQMAKGFLPLTSDLPFPIETIRQALTRMLTYDRVPEAMKQSAREGLQFLDVCKLGDQIGRDVGKKQDARNNVGAEDK